MRQHRVVEIVDRLQGAHGYAVTSSEVVEALSYELDVVANLADVSRTLLRATRNGRLWRRAGHTGQGGWFRYEYGVTRKGEEWLYLLSARWEMETDTDTDTDTDTEAGAEVANTPEADALSPPEDDDHLAPADWERCGDCSSGVASEDRFCRMCGTRFETCDGCDSPLVGGECPSGCE